ncbi:hypothetical protein BDZ91DRAFT_801957 [Kalaharituber pfeilii]|nr:hypothetical protein BDZ91DRAFT_801957 [Kalaharituber pfeilii]
MSSTNDTPTAETAVQSTPEAPTQVLTPESEPTPTSTEFTSNAETTEPDSKKTSSESAKSTQPTDTKTTTTIIPPSPIQRTPRSAILTPIATPALSTSTSTFPSAIPPSLRSPAFPSELPRSPMSSTFPPPDPQKTPITPPVAYTDFLKNAIASPADLKSPKFLPHHHHPSGYASAGPSSPAVPHEKYIQATTAAGRRYRASLSGPSGGMPSPGLYSLHAAAAAAAHGQGVKREAHTPTSALSSANSSTSSLSSTLSTASSVVGSGSERNPASRNCSGTTVDRSLSSNTITTSTDVSSDATARTTTVHSTKKVVRFAKPHSRAENAEGGKMDVERKEGEGEAEGEDEVMEEVDCTRRKSISKDGMVTIKQVVTTTVTFKPRMSLMPAPKGKRRRIE